MARLMSNFQFKAKYFYSRFYSYYEVPERYRNSFYLVNASLFDSVNLYLHKAYEFCFPNLINNFLEKQPYVDEYMAINRVKNIIQLFEQCNSIIDVRFPIKRANGNWEIIKGFRAQHGLACGYLPSLGGLMINEGITKDQMEALCVLTTYKHSCFGINMSGAYGGIRINPSNYSEQELKTVIENYTRELYLKGYCHSDGDILEPDMNTSSLEMSWIALTHSKCAAGKDDISSNNAAVGKPKSLGGLENFEKIAGLGMFFALDYFMNNEKILHEIGLEKGLKGKTFIIQGLGKTAISLINYLTNSGAVCVGVRESAAHLYNSNGVNIEAIIKHKNKFGSIKNFECLKFDQPDNIFKEECDILILADQHKSLTCSAAENVKAKIIVEASNCALTPIAHKMLVSSLKLVLPDIYVTAGLSLASYLEYLLNRRQAGIQDIDSSKHIFGDVVNALYLEQIPEQIALSSTSQKISGCSKEPNIITCFTEFVMTETANELLNLTKEYKLNLDLRTAAYIKAIQNISQSLFTKY